MEFIWFIAIYFILNDNIELISWIFAAPITLHDPVNEFPDISDFLVGFIFIELISFPNENFVLIMFMTRLINLRFDT